MARTAAAMVAAQFVRVAVMDQDNLDLAIFFLCAFGLVGFVGVEIGEYTAMKKRSYCAATLADGRELTTRWLGPQGDAQCTYAPSYGAKKWRRG
jgi:hypothetical protein